MDGGFKFTLFTHYSTNSHMSVPMYVFYENVFVYWPAKETLQNLDAICFIVKTKNSNYRT